MLSKVELEARNHSLRATRELEERVRTLQGNLIIPIKLLAEGR
jgi:hypothetical protein